MALHPLLGLKKKLQYQEIHLIKTQQREWDRKRERDRHKKRESDRQRETQKDRETDRQRETKTGRVRHKKRDSDRQRERVRHKKRQTGRKSDTKRERDRQRDVEEEEKRRGGKDSLKGFYCERTNRWQSCISSTQTFFLVGELGVSWGRSISVTRHQNVVLLSRFCTNMFVLL